jgi:sortase A
LTLGYCAYAGTDAWIFQHRGGEAFERHLLDQTHSAPSPEVGTDGVIGRIEISRLGISTLVIEGTGEPSLRRAAGHIAGTALPGHPGNVGIAGHRDSFFRPLRNIHRDDIITLATLRGEYRYRVVSTKIVDPDDVTVLKADGEDVLTLVTCYPFYFVGSAPSRFIVRAQRVI